MTVYDTALAEVLARLQGSPPVISNNNIRRKHQTEVTREDSPAVRLIDGADKATEGSCRTDHDAEFTVRLIFRGDDESISADAWNLAAEVKSRLNPRVTPYANSVQVEEPTITPDQEVADLDLYALDMVFPMKYSTEPWAS